MLAVLENVILVVANTCPGRQEDRLDRKVYVAIRRLALLEERSVDLQEILDVLDEGHRLARRVFIFLQRRGLPPELVVEGDGAVPAELKRIAAPN